MLCLQSGRCRTVFDRGMFRLRPVVGQDGPKTHGTLLVHLDPAMPGGIDPPTWAVRWILSVFAPFMFSQVGVEFYFGFYSGCRA